MILLTVQTFGRAMQGKSLVNKKRKIKDNAEHYVKCRTMHGNA